MEEILYNDQMRPEKQIAMEERIASAVFECEPSGEGFSLKADDCSQLGRDILRMVLAEFRPDLIAGAEPAGSPDRFIRVELAVGWPDYTWSDLNHVDVPETETDLVAAAVEQLEEKFAAQHVETAFVTGYHINTEERFNAAGERVWPAKGEEQE